MNENFRYLVLKSYTDYFISGFEFEDSTFGYSLYQDVDQLNLSLIFILKVNHLLSLFQLKKLKESIEDCTAALALDEKYMKALLRRAKSYMDLEMFDEAVRDYEAAQR